MRKKYLCIPQLLNTRAGLVTAILAAALLSGVPSAPALAQKKYEATWESLDSRPVPEWFEDAKFGIFIHWGAYSVPAWAPVGVYSEWYQYWLRGKNTSGNNNPEPTAVYDHHVAKYGEDFSYYRFGEMFKALDYDPAAWADLFEKAGAKYIVITSKHHDGFALWPSEEADNTWGFPWNSKSTGAGRDLLGELTGEIRKTDIKLGFYYSLYEWYNPLWQTDREKFVEEHFLPQVKDLVISYEPDILWADGEWEMTAEEWKSKELLAWLYNESPVKDKILVNDRWGKGVRQHHGGYYTTEYDAAAEFDKPWEECRGIGYSFGYNRNEDLGDYNSAQALILMLVDIVSHGGNLLLDIGPDASGKIPPIMQERLLQIGDWLEVNGEAIYGTRKWKKTVQWSEGRIIDGNDYKKEKNLSYLGGDFILKQTVDPDPGMAVKEVFFTSKGNDVYAIMPRLPEGTFLIKGVHASPETTVQLLGKEQATISWEKKGDDLLLTVPAISARELADAPACTFKLTNIQ